MTEALISTYVTDTTRDLVERYVEAHGLKKGHFIEQALLHHLHALRELPVDLLAPPRVMVGQETFKQVADLARCPRKPTKALRKLMGRKKAR